MSQKELVETAYNIENVKLVYILTRKSLEEYKQALAEQKVVNATPLVQAMLLHNMEECMQPISEDTENLSR